MGNLALIRRRINDPRLKFSFSRMAGRTNTVVCLCWLEGVTEPKLLEEARRRLDTYALDGILDANYLSEWIRDDRTSPSPPSAQPSGRTSWPQSCSKGGSPSL